jgi:hypothetical protein
VLLLLLLSFADDLDEKGYSLVQRKRREKREEGKKRE